MANLPSWMGGARLGRETSEKFYYFFILNFLYFFIRFFYDAYSDGTSHLLFTPGEFIEKLFIKKYVPSFLHQNPIGSNGAGYLRQTHLAAKK